MAVRNAVFSFAQLLVRNARVAGRPGPPVSAGVSEECRDGVHRAFASNELLPCEKLSRCGGMSVRVQIGEAGANEKALQRTLIDYVQQVMEVPTAALRPDDGAQQTGEIERCLRANMRGGTARTQRTATYSNGVSPHVEGLRVGRALEDRRHRSRPPLGRVRFRRWRDARAGPLPALPLPALSRKPSPAPGVIVGSNRHRRVHPFEGAERLRTRISVIYPL